MIPSRCAVVLLACVLLTARAVGQAPTPAPAPFAEDERSARVAERYRTMLAANPTEGLALDRLWQMYEERHATATLLDEYRRLTDASPKTADVLVYGHLLKRAGRLDEAAGSYERAARLDPASPLPLIAQAELAVGRSQPAAAAALFEQALAKASGSDRRRNDWLGKLGQAWLAAGQPAKAAEAWEKIVAAQPADLALRQRLAATYEKNGLPARAITHYEYIDQHADPAARAAALRELGRLHEAQGEFDAARDALERGLALTARDNWLHGDLQSRLIRLYQRAGRASELATRWQTAVEQAPRDLGGYGRLVALAEAQGDPTAARTWLEKLVALAPGDRDATLKLAGLLANAGTNERAAALYDALLKVQPTNLDLIFARADLDLRMGRAAEAVAHVEERVRQNPADDSVAVPALQFFLSHRLDAAAEDLLAGAVARQPRSSEATLALAKFYFARARAAEALKVIGLLVGQPGDAATRAQRWTAAAECCREAGQMDEALRGWTEAARLQPDQFVPMVAVGEMQFARGDVAAGTAQLERAIAAAPPGPKRDEIDHKLFQALSDRSPAEEIVPGGPARGRMGHSIAIGPPPGSSTVPGGEGRNPQDPAGPLLQYLAGLAKAAHESPESAAYLRLARWWQWAHRPHEAGLAADSALALEPQSIPAREILADAAIAQHNHGAALRRLGEIAALEPRRKPAVVARIADVMLDDGEFDGALVLLERRAQDAPGSVDALTDLALAQQRADRWFDALATWERAYALPRLTPAQRADLRRPLVAVYEHVGQFGRAAELLQAAIDAQDDLAARQELFRELVASCQAHSLGDWLEGLYKDRLAAQPQDYFAMTAVAELQKTAGDPRAAYRLLERAYYSAPDAPAALHTLVAQAEALGETDEAIAHQRRLTGLPGQANPENLEKLAGLEETGLDDEAAAGVWEHIAATFPRDTAALGAAADYFLRARLPVRARGLLAEVAALDPGDFRRLYQLAQLDSRAGDRAGARACLEAVLVHTRDEAAGDALILPRELDPATDPAEFMAAAAKTSDHAAGGTPVLVSEPAHDEGGERGVRLAAIGELSGLFFSEDAPASDHERKLWLDRWSAAAARGARSEPLAAFFYAGQSAAVSDLTASWLRNEVADETGHLKKVFLLAGLRMGNYAPLARWTWSEDGPDRAERSGLLIETIQYFLSTGGRPAPDFVTVLFPAELKSRPLLWTVASGTFADQRWYPQAVELGERAIALPGGDLAGNAFQLAQWELDVGRLDAARSILGRAAEAGEGSAFDAAAGNAVFADLRAYYLLLPAAERSGFVRDYLRRRQSRGGPGVHAILAAALLHGLEGDEQAACRALDQIVDLGLLDGRPGGDEVDLRRWTYLSVCGAQLKAWHLDRLAAHVWRQGLARASAFDQRDPEVGSVLQDMRLQQLVAEVTTAADPQESCELVAAYVRETPTPSALASAAAALATAGQYDAVVQIQARLKGGEPPDPDRIRASLLAAQKAGDGATVDTILKAMLDRDPLRDDPATREIILLAASLAESAGEPERACRLLVEARRFSPESPAVLQGLARTLERQHRPEDAAAIWREAIRYDRGAASTDALASLELQRGHREAAFTLARDAPEPSTEAERASWFDGRVAIYAATGHEQAAVDLTRQWVTAGKTDGLAEAAAILAAHGQRQAAGELCKEALGHARDPQARLELQRALLRTVYTAADVPMADFLRELRRLGALADAAGAQRNAYLEDRYTLAVARGATDWLRTELTLEWDDGKGAVAAADQLVTLYVATGQPEALRVLVEQVDARPNLSEQTLYSLETRLLKAGHPAWALPVAERLCRRFPQNANYAAARARVLWQSGRHDEAIQVLTSLDAACDFRGDGIGRAALVYTEIGDRAGAIASLERMVALDPLAVRSSPLYRQLAALYLADNRREDAFRMLAVAYSNPAQADPAPLVDALAAADRLKIGPDGELPGGDLPLTFLNRAHLLAALCDRLRQTGHGRDAFGLAAAHPVLLPAVPRLVSTLRHDATLEQIPALIGLLEQAIHQSNGSPAALQTELARVYVRQAELTAASQAPRAAEGALNWLTKAYELSPEDFGVVQPLAVALRQQHQDARARVILRPFLEASALPSESAVARQILAAKD